MWGLAVIRVSQITKLACGPYIFGIGSCIGVDRLFQSPFAEEKVRLAKSSLLVLFRSSVSSMQDGISRDKTCVEADDWSWPLCQISLELDSLRVRLHPFFIGLSQTRQNTAQGWVNSYGPPAVNTATQPARVSWAGSRLESLYHSVLTVRASLNS